MNLKTKGFIVLKFCGYLQLNLRNKFLFQWMLRQKVSNILKFLGNLN